MLLSTLHCVPVVQLVSGICYSSPASALTVLSLLLFSSCSYGFLCFCSWYVSGPATSILHLLAVEWRATLVSVGRLSMCRWLTIGSTSLLLAEDVAIDETCYQHDCKEASMGLAPASPAQTDSQTWLAMMAPYICQHCLSMMHSA